MSAPSNAFLLVISGQRGFGKTSLLKGWDPPGQPGQPGLLSRLPGRVVLVDPIGSFAEIAEGIPTASRFAELLLQLDAGEWEYPSSIFRLVPENDTDAGAMFALLYESKLRCTIVVDEASMWHGDSHLESIAQYNRNPERGGQSLVVVARRLKELPPNIRSQADVTVSFRQQEPGDLSELRKLGFDESKLIAMDKGELMAAGALSHLPSGVKNVIDSWHV